jgi:hypothetical protein
MPLMTRRLSNSFRRTVVIARRAAAALLLCSLTFANLPALKALQATSATPAATADFVERIKDEGLNRSQLMQTLAHLTDVIGPRLTASPAARRANEWTRDRLTSWGLQNAHLEPWGPFGRGWTLKRFSAEVVAPLAFPLLAYPRAWSPGLDAPLSAEVVTVDANNDAELEKHKGQLRGKIVLTGALRELKPKFDPVATRLTEKQLLDYANAPDPATIPPRAPQPPRPEQIEAAKFNDRKTKFYYDEGAALLVSPSPAGDGGMLQFVQSASVPQPFDTPFDKRVNPWDASAPKIIPQISISNDHFNRLVRMIRMGEKPRMTVNLEVEWSGADDPMGYNTVAEIPGGDLKDEVVMLGAHLDSWHTGTGATDNAAGVSVMMEAVRILKALNTQPRRAIRIALWTGEEQGLLGSRFYVKEHFGPVAAPTTAATAANASPASRFKPEHDKLNVYFNADSGTGAVRGFYLQGNEALRPIFRRWLAPFREFKIKDKDGRETDYSASTITVSNAGGSDFLSFDAVGLVGLDFLQDDIEYETRTWHSNQDMYDRVIPEDVKQAAVIVAAFVYNAAMMDGKLPRKPLRENRPGS